jgi:hypothetical protein
MKSSAGKLILTLIIIMSAFFISCGSGANSTPGDIPTISLSVPGALTAAASKDLSRATSAGGTATNSLENIKVLYDETDTYPVLKGWMTIKAGLSETYPRSLYFNATKNSAGNIVLEGGVSYNFVFGGHATWTNDYTSERSYMFKAFANSDGTKAKVALDLPLSTVTTVTENHDIKSSFLDILYEWLISENSVDLDTLLSATITDADSLGTALEAYSGTNDDDIEFVLSLTNAIAYSDTNGYEGNQGNAATPYPTDTAYDLGDPGTIAFSLSPVAIEALTEPGTTFTFLTD